MLEQILYVRRLFFYANVKTAFILYRPGHVQVLFRHSATEFLS